MSFFEERCVLSKRRLQTDVFTAQELLRPAVDVLYSEYALGFSGVGRRIRAAANTPEMVRRYIVAVNGADCSLPGLAEKFEYSVYHLSHLYRSWFGETIGDTIDRVRREFFRRHASGDIGEDELCRTLGFSSLAGLRAWSRRNGVSKSRSGGSGPGSRPRGGRNARRGGKAKET